MRLNTSTHLRLEQRMKLSPRMIQSMEILQLPTLALEQRVNEELAANPVLEKLDSPYDQGPDLAPVAGIPAAALEKSPATGSDSASDDPSARAGSDPAAPSPTLWSDDHNETFFSPRSGARRPAGDRDPKLAALANAPAPGASLSEQLLAQWNLLDIDESTRSAGQRLIEWIDPDGYIRESIDVITRDLPPGVRRQDVERAWPLLQRRLEPAGIGARNLRECLLLQLDALARDQKELVHAPRLLVERHLADLEMNRLPQIARRSGLSLEQIKQARAFLARFLHPSPGRLLIDSRATFVTPDAVIEPDEQTGRYHVRLADDHLPRLCINEVYSRMARPGEPGVDEKTHQFLADHIRNARWLIDAIEQRRHTLLRVLRVAAEAQKDFIDLGPKHLRPLPMTAVAERLGVHVATVSRAVADKYVNTPRGVIPLRRFFSGGTEDSTGQAVSWDAIRVQLEEMVQSEDRKNPLADDEIVARLREKGITLARRTVAKYRKICKIPPARRRREY
jgi:RNA polymerase sigma-54 factor